MYLKDIVHLINMWKFYFEDVCTILTITDWYNEDFRKVLFWCQKWIFNSLGESYIETVTIKVVDNNSNYNLSEIIYLDAP
jgi:hypothetical protein